MVLRTQALACAVGISLAALATPASATLFFYVDITVNGVTDTLFCAATSACNTSGSLNEITLGASILNGVKFKGEDDTANGTSTSPGIAYLNSSVGTVTNTNSYTATINVIVGDTSFAYPVSSASLAAAGTFQSSVGSTFTTNWYVDTTNAQGAVGGTLPGTKIASYTAPTITSVVQGISYTSAPMTVDYTAPYSVTEQTLYTLKPGGEVLNRGQTAIFTGVPEVSTWSMMLLGFVGLGWTGYRNTRKNMAVAY